MKEFLSSENIYNRVDEIRTARGWTIYELAKRAGIAEASIHNWRDRKSSPSLYLLEAISEAFGISIIQLLINDDEIAALTEEQQDLVKRWTSLKDHQKRALLEMIKAFELDG